MSADGILAGTATHTARGILPEGLSAASANGRLFVLQAESDSRNAERRSSMFPLSNRETRDKRKKKHGKK
jgi:hypothetical protein